MKDFIFITIICAAFTFFVAGLVYVYISSINERIKRAYDKGYADGQKRSDKV